MSSQACLAQFDQIGESRAFDGVTDHFARHYGIPNKVVRRFIKLRLAKSYSNQNARFDKGLQLKAVPFSMLRYFGALGWALVWSRRKKIVTEKPLLLIDDIRSEHELERFGPIIEKVGQDNIFVVMKKGMKGVSQFGFRVEVLEPLKGYEFSQVLRVIWKELRFGLFLYVKESLSLKLNIFVFASRLTQDFLYASRLSEEVSPQYILRERIYETSSVINFVMTKRTNCTTITLQKNIFQRDGIFFFSDTDWLFALGSETGQDYERFGGRVGKLVPVGSLFMEYYWFKENKLAELPLVIDVLVLGINTSRAYDRLDSYEEFFNDYYGAIAWLPRVKRDLSLGRIMIKHHASADIDRREDEIIAGSGIEIMERSGNSYLAAMKAKCIVTYGSTMGYELAGHGKSVIFLDPEGRNTFLPQQVVGDCIYHRARNYESFKKLVGAVLSNIAFPPYKGKAGQRYCLDSEHVSSRIASVLLDSTE
jgi:hypothetical protein